MDAYDDRLVPGAFGQHNTGATCYFNSFWQMLIGCPAFTRGVLQNADYLRGSATGAAVVNFVTAYASSEAACGRPADGVEFGSTLVLHALTKDLATRRPHVCFGGGQESASEALIHLLDMMEPQFTTDHVTDGSAIKSTASPITRLFLHRFRCDVHCRKCGNLVSNTTDYAVNFNLFHFDQLRVQPANAADFSKAVRLQASMTEDYRCPACPCTTCGATPVEGKCPTCRAPAAKTTAFRIYNLTMVPEIVLCMFNLYDGFGGAHRARYFPEHLEFPACGGGLLVFRIVGQVEHSGALSGGHYWARGLRADGRVYLLNDTGVSPASFAPTANTYIVAYHYVGCEGKDESESPG